MISMQTQLFFRMWQSLHSFIRCNFLQKVKVKLLSRVQLFATPWTVTYQAPLSMGFSRQEYWSGLPFPSPGDLPDPGIEPRSPALQADTLTSEPPGKPYSTTKKNVRAIFHKYWHSVGEGSGTPLQYSCLENPMDGGAWWAAVHGVAKSQT